MRYSRRLLTKSYVRIMICLRYVSIRYSRAADSAWRNHNLRELSFQINCESLDNNKFKILYVYIIFLKEKNYSFLGMHWCMEDQTGLFVCCQYHTYSKILTTPKVFWYLIQDNRDIKSIFEIFLIPFEGNKWHWWTSIWD